MNLGARPRHIRTSRSAGLRFSLTAPTGVPLSLWLVHRAASTEGGSLALESFLRSCIKGVLALGCFCFGALALVRLRPSPADGSLPSVGALLAAGYTGWAVAWMVLRSV